MASWEDFYTMECQVLRKFLVVVRGECSDNLKGALKSARATCSFQATIEEIRMIGISEDLD